MKVSDDHFDIRTCNGLNGPGSVVHASHQILCSIQCQVALPLLLDFLQFGSFGKQYMTDKTLSVVSDLLLPVAGRRRPGVGLFVGRPDEVPIPMGKPPPLHQHPRSVQFQGTAITPKDREICVLTEP